MNTATTPITSESVAAWMAEQLAKAHELSDYAHVQVHAYGMKTALAYPVNFSAYLDASRSSAEHPTIEACLAELQTMKPKTQAELKRERAAALLKEADELEAASL